MKNIRELLADAIFFIESLASIGSTARYYRAKDRQAREAKHNALPRIPEGMEYAQCPECDSVLGLSEERYPNTLCSCGFTGIPVTISKDRATMLFRKDALEGRRKVIIDELKDIKTQLSSISKSS